MIPAAYSFFYGKSDYFVLELGKKQVQAKTTKWLLCDHTAAQCAGIMKTEVMQSGVCLTCNSEFEENKFLSQLTTCLFSVIYIQNRCRTDAMLHLFSKTFEYFF